MNPDISDKINTYLKKNDLTPLFPYNPHQKTMFRKDFVVSWTHNYTTIVTRDNTEYFFKVALEKQKFEDLERQVDFYQLLEEQKHLTFKTPKLYEWNTSGDFYFYLREKMNGVLLGNCVRAIQEFATKRIFHQLQMGLAEINHISMIDKTYWHKTKDTDWIKHKIQRTNENEILQQAIGLDLWQQIQHNILSTLHPLSSILKLSPLWGDPGPNNFLVDNGQLAIIDYSPYTYGYDGADFAEFASFCIFSPEWEQFVDSIYSPPSTLHPRSSTLDPQLFNIFFAIFLIDRMASVLWLESRGQLKIQLKNNKEFYVEKIRNKLQEVLSASRRIEP